MISATYLQLDMPEPSSIFKVQNKLSSEERLALIQALSGLPLSQMLALEFALYVPPEVMPAYDAAMGLRSKVLLDWVEGSTGVGMSCFLTMLEKVVGISWESIKMRGTNKLEDSASTQVSAPSRLQFSIKGSIEKTDFFYLQELLTVAREKSGDSTLEISYVEEGSIKVTFQGSEAGLKRLKELFDAGLLQEIGGHEIMSVNSIPDPTSSSNKQEKPESEILRKYDSTQFDIVPEEDIRFIQSSLSRPYINVMELIVAEEVTRQIKGLSPRILKYIKLSEVESYALNRLPSLYASSEKGWQHQYQRAKKELMPKVKSAVRQALAAVQVDPIRSSSPLPPSKSSNESEEALGVLEELFQKPDITWKEVVSRLSSLLDSRHTDKPFERPAHESLERPTNKTKWRPGTYGDDVFWKEKGRRDIAAESQEDYKSS